jgi:hypothetical protein
MSRQSRLPRRIAMASFSLFAEDEAGDIHETLLSFAPTVLENAPDQVRQIVENLPRWRANLCQADLARQPFEIKRAFWCQYLKRDRRPEGLCMYPGCEEIPIRNSHAITRAGALSLIAEAGHVATPALSVRTGKTHVTRGGLRRASTFPGFCRLHELEFSQFERAKALKSGRDWQLQFFRTACWEMRNLIDGIATLKRVQVGYDRQIEKNLRNILPADGLVVEARNVDQQQKTLQREIRKLKNYKARFARQVLNPLEQDLVDGGDRFGCVVLKVGVVLPLCLAGSGFFTWRWHEDGRKQKVLALLQVLPTSTGTCIAICASADAHECILGYLKESVGRRGGLATMLQTWMTQGTDQWFLRPSVWEGLPMASRISLERDIGSTFDLAHTLNYGLFATSWIRTSSARDPCFLPKVGHSAWTFWVRRPKRRTLCRISSAVLGRSCLQVCETPQRGWVELVSLQLLRRSSRRKYLGR